VGFGKRLGIDLIGETEGIVPDIQWKRENRKDIWYDGDTLNLSIGQGYLLVTPLQLNALTNLIANRGVLMRPHIVKEIRFAKNDEISYTNEPQILIKSNIERSKFEFVIQAMRGVVTHGTARWGGAVFSVEAAGKTSSSEVQGMPTHSWYTAFAPYTGDNGDQVISVTAIIEHGGAGSAVAAPVVAEILEAYFSGADLYTARRNIWKARASLRKVEESEGD
jgi:penicillin-binding protein 2